VRNEYPSLFETAINNVNAAVRALQGFVLERNGSVTVSNRTLPDSLHVCLQELCANLDALRNIFPSGGPLSLLSKIKVIFDKDVLERHMKNLETNRSTLLVILEVTGL